MRYDSLSFVVVAFFGVHWTGSVLGEQHRILPAGGGGPVRVCIRDSDTDQITTGRRPTPIGGAADTTTRWRFGYGLGFVGGVLQGGPTLYTQSRQNGPAGPAVAPPTATRASVVSKGATPRRFCCLCPVHLAAGSPFPRWLGLECCWRYFSVARAATIGYRSPEQLLPGYTMYVCISVERAAFSVLAGYTMKLCISAARAASSVLPGYTILLCISVARAALPEYIVAIVSR